MWIRLSTINFACSSRTKMLSKSLISQNKEVFIKLKFEKKKELKSQLNVKSFILVVPN